jgi:hypothetical protein
MKMTKANETLTAPQSKVQVFVRRGADVCAFRVHDLAGLNPMDELRPKFGWSYREERGAQYCRFGMNNVPAMRPS